MFSDYNIYSAERQLPHTGLITRYGGGNQILDRFAASLNKGNETTTIIAPTLGSSACTFICSVPLTELRQEAPYQDSLRFIVKWSKQDMIENEMLCSALFRDVLKLRSPKISSLNQVPISMKLIPGKKGWVEDFDPATQKAMIMKKFNAYTLDDLFKQKRLESISSAAWHNLLENIGELIVYDLLIGNDDRLFNYDFNSPNLLGSPKINGGNLMVGAKKGFHPIYPIDNATSQKIHKLAPIVDQAADFMGDNFLFREETVLAEPVDEPTTLTQDEIVAKMSQAFALHTKQKHDIVRHVKDGLISELKSNKTKLSIESSEMDRSLEKGMEKALQRLKALDDQVLAPFSSSTYAPLSQCTLKLVQANLQSVKKP